MLACFHIFADEHHFATTYDEYDSMDAVWSMQKDFLEEHLSDHKNVRVFPVIKGEKN